MLSNFSAQFMQENIVGTILIFSLLLWLPASCIVHIVVSWVDLILISLAGVQLWCGPWGLDLCPFRQKGRSALCRGKFSNGLLYICYVDLLMIFVAHESNEILKFLTISFVSKFEKYYFKMH